MVSKKITQALGRSAPYVEVLPPPIIAQRAPASTDIIAEGQLWIDASASPRAVYTHLGDGDYDQGGNPLATTTVPGIVLINTDGTLAGADNSTVPTSLAVKTYADALAIAGAPDATTAVKGISYLADATDVVSPWTSGLGVDNVVVPIGQIETMFGAPPAIGGTTAAAASFTTLAATGAVDFDSGGSWESGGANDIDIGADANTDAINIGTAGNRAIQLGDDGGTSSLEIQAGTGNMVVRGATATTIAIGTGLTSGTITVGATGNTGTMTISPSTGTQTVNIANANGAKTINVGSGITGNTISVGNGANSSAQTINIAAGATAANSTVNILTGNGSAGTQTFNVLSGTRAGAVNIADGAAAHVVTIGNASAGAITVDTAAGISLDAATASNFTVTGASADLTLSSSGGSVNITATEAAADAIVMNASDGAGGVQIQAGTGGILVGNQADCTTIDVGDIAPTASRTITIGGGTVVTASVTDLIDIAPDGATTNADSIKQVDINTGTVATGQSLTNIATGTITSGTHTVEIQTGNAAAGTVACNISTGTGTKTVSVGNADGLTTTAILGPLNVNVNQNNNVAINTGTSTGTISIGNTAAGAVVLNSGSTIAIGDASAGAITVDTAAGVSLDGATASNFTVTGAGQDLTLSSVGGSVLVESTEDAALAIRLHANAGTSETIQIHSDQGTGTDSINLLSDVGGITLTATGLANAAALDFNAPAGGLDVDVALAVAIDTAAGISLDAATASNFTVTGASADLTLSSSGGSVNITATEAAADAIVINASDAAGGIDLTTGGGSIDISSSGLVTMVPGTQSVASPTASATQNTNVGVVTFTGFTTAAAGTQDFTITNSEVAATSGLFVNVANLNASTNGAEMSLAGVTQAAGSFIVHTENTGSGALGAGDNVLISFWVIS